MIHLSKAPIVMGILNVTPDSFSDGGQYSHLDAAYDQAMAMLEQGATIIDIGGESTKPGAQAVSVEQELSRVMPVLERIKSQSQAYVSIDTKKTEVMRAAIAAGADMINDVNALRDDGAIDVIAQSQVSVCLMHMQGMPDSMQNNPQYKDVVDEVYQFLAQRVECCTSHEIALNRIVIDPGFGFGKSCQHNYQLLANMSKFKSLGVPVLAGISRKSMLGQVTGRAVEDRLSGSLAAAMVALQQGATVLRVHDVAETVDAVKVYRAVIAEKG